MLVAGLVAEQLDAGELGDVPGPVAFLDSEKDLRDDLRRQAAQVDPAPVAPGARGPHPLLQVNVGVCAPKRLRPLGMRQAEPLKMALGRVAAPVAEVDPAEARMRVGGEIRAGGELFQALAALLEVPHMGGADH
ncbi:hypothetical protein ACFY7Y_32590 [Streptomyces virginiae]|uniref:hypothetical protein n=1 Tax=Streptomyces virginiae TaxID=1961 RepID=UPI0036BF1B82